MRMRIAVFLSALGLLLGIGGAAQATVTTGGTQDGYMTYTEYHNVWYQQTWGSIENYCNCHGTYTRYDGTNQWVVFDAANSTFAWDICWVGIHMWKHADGKWYASPQQGGAERIACDGTQYLDDLATATPA